jgi:hypothetical protein
LDYPFNRSPDLSRRIANSAEELNTLRTREAIHFGFRYNSNSGAMGDIKAILRRRMNRRLYFALSRVKRNPSVVLQVAKNELAVRRVVARSKKPDTGPKDWFSGIDDESWFWMNTVGRRKLKSVAAIVPGVPDESMQANFTGGVEDTTFREGFAAYQLFNSRVTTKSMGSDRVLPGGPRTSNPLIKSDRRKTAN